MVRYSGTLKNVDGSPRVGTFGVSFAIYADQASTAPLWQEVQNVVVDETGHYSALLGAARAEGLPSALFADNTARWLGIRVENEPEQPRVLLAAVPYALKAADAETLGGKPLSAFLLNENTSGTSATAASGSAASSETRAGTVQPLLNTGSTGTQNYVAKWVDSAGTLGNSVLYDSGNGLVGIGKVPSLATLDVAGGAAFNGTVMGGDYLLGGLPYSRLGENTANGAPYLGYNIIWNNANSRYEYLANGTLGGVVPTATTVSIYSANSGAAGAPAPTPMIVATPSGVGIGKAPSGTMLDVNGDAAFSGTVSGGDYLLGGLPYARLGENTGNGAPYLGYNIVWNNANSRYEYVANGNMGAVVPTATNVSIYSGNSGLAGNAVPSPMIVATPSGVGIGKVPSQAMLDVGGSLAASGTVTATTFSGSGSGLTSLPAGTLSGAVPSTALSGTYDQAITFSNPSNTFNGSGAGLTSLNLSGTYSNAVTLSNAGNSFAGSGASLTNVAAASVGTVPATTANLRLITYLGGCDSCSVLTTSDSQKLIYQNLLGSSLTFLSITCYSDVGSPSINIQRDNGSTANVTATAIGCSTTGNTVSSFSVLTLAANEKLNLLMTTPDGAAHRVTVIIKATL